MQSGMTGKKCIVRHMGVTNSLVVIWHSILSDWWKVCSVDGKPPLKKLKIPLKTSLTVIDGSEIFGYTGMCKLSISKYIIIWLEYIKC